MASAGDESNAGVGLTRYLGYAFGVIPHHRPVHEGGSLGAGHGVSAFFASHVVDVTPPCLNPALQLNVAVLPWLLPSLRLTSPLAGGEARGPVHWVRVQLPLGLPFAQVMAPLYPGVHVHPDVPEELTNMCMLVALEVPHTPQSLRENDVAP